MNPPFTLHDPRLPDLDEIKLDISLSLFNSNLPPIISMREVSGGAIALGLADGVLILENSIYSVISPEGCAAILWNDSAKAPEAAAALKMNGAELLKLGIVDEVIPEPLGGAHRDVEVMAKQLATSIHTHLKQLEKQKKDKLVSAREEKYRRMSALASS